LTGGLRRFYDRHNSDAFGAYLCPMSYGLNEWLSLKEGYGVRLPSASVRFFLAAAPVCPPLSPR